MKKYTYLMAALLTTGVCFAEETVAPSSAPADAMAPAGGVAKKKKKKKKKDAGEVSKMKKDAEGSGASASEAPKK